jgi:hypothetical protein
VSSGNPGSIPGKTSFCFWSCHLHRLGYVVRTTQVALFACAMWRAAFMTKKPVLYRLSIVNARLTINHLKILNTIKSVELFHYTLWQIAGRIFL